MKRLLTILALVCCIGTHARENPDSLARNRLTLDFGVNRIREENLHPKVHTGTITGLEYGRACKSKNITGWGIGFRYSRLKTSYEDLSASANIQIRAHYHYLFRVIQGKYTYAVGPEVKVIYNVGLYPNWDESHIYWANTFSVGVDNEFRYEISETRSLIFNGTISVLSFLSRPDPNRQYKFDDLSFGGIVDNFHSNMVAGTVNKAFTCVCLAEYKFGISNRLSQGLFYRVEYSRMKGSPALPFQQNMHHVGLKLYF